jgi:hypothetical protein
MFGIGEAPSQPSPTCLARSRSEALESYSHDAGALTRHVAEDYRGYLSVKQRFSKGQQWRA